MRLFILTFGFLCCAFYGIAQEESSLRFNVLTDNDKDMPAGIFGITQDSLGYIWLASANGLSKYDGRTVEFFPNNFISEGDIVIYDKKIYTDKDNKTWIITGERHIEQLNDKEESFKRISSIPLPKVIFQSKNRDYFIGTSYNGIFKIDNKTKDTIQLLQSEKLPVNVNEITEYKNAIWASSTSGVYKIINQNQCKKYTIPIENESQVTVIGASEKHGVYVGTYLNQLFRYNEGTDKFEAFNGFPNFLFQNELYIHNLFFDSKDRLWIGTYGQGLYLVDFNAETIFNYKYDKQNPNSIPYDCITAIYEDNTNNIWIGTDGGGLCLYDQKLYKFNSLTNVNVPNGINLNLAKILAVNDNGDLWVGTHNYGLVHVDSSKTKFRLYNKENSELNSDKIAFIKIIGNDLWIANETPEIQILKPDGKILTFNSTSNPKLDVAYIYDIFEDSKHRVWLSTSDQGLIQFDTEKGIIKHYKHESSNENSISSNLIYSIAEDNNNGIWIGTKYKGLCRIDTVSDKVEHFPEFEGLAKFLYIDSEDMVWIASNTKGLVKFNPVSRVQNIYDHTKGIEAATIYAILPYDDDLWLSSSDGLIKFNTITLEVESYGKPDGLQSTYFASRSAAKDEKNELLYFGGIKGVNWFNPESIQRNLAKPITTISKVEVNEQERSVFSREQFQHNENTINFTFNSLHYSSPERNSFKYKLVNYDKDWKSSGNINFVRYTNLPPNDYEFQVISCNYDEVWNENPARYAFTIKKPWYGTTLAYVIYVLLFLSAVYIFLRYLKWRLEIKNKLEYEHKEAERLKQLDDYKTKLYNNISHEFRTPLTLISGPIDHQLSKANISENDKHDLNIIKRNSKRLLNLVNQLLDLSKLETGNLKLHVSKGDLGVLLKQLAAAFEFKSKDKQQNFTYDIPQITDVWFDRDVVEKIVSNLLGNAIKYTPKKGNIAFRVTKNEGSLSISVVNNGNILNDEELPRLFQRYYQNNSYNEGVGIGLSLVKELTVLSHGTVIAHTMNSDEIQFVVTLPIEKDFFSASELSLESAHLNSNLGDIPEEKVIRYSNQLDSKPLVLLVEDDIDIRSFVKSILSDDFIIIEATNGKQGVDLAIANIPDIIISDVMMPVMDGIELCNTLKEDFKTSHIPIVLLTAKSGDQNEIEGLKTGADAYLTKPFSIEKLQIQIENLIANRIKLQAYYGRNNVLDFHNIKSSKTEEQFFENLQTAIKEHVIQSDFTAEGLSELMHMSRMQLHRKLKALLGLSTTEFIRNERLKIAKSLLQTSDLTVSEIAYQTGFNSPSYFIKCFKKVYKVTPSEYDKSS